MVIVINMIGYKPHESRFVVALEFLKVLEKRKDLSLKIFSSADTPFQSLVIKTPRSRGGALLYEQFIFPWKARWADRVISFSPTFPILSGRKNFVMIHDLGYLFFKEEASFSARLFWRFFYWAAVRWARGVFVPTEAVKRDLISAYKGKPGNICVTSEAVPGLFSAPADGNNAVLTDLKIKKPYFLYLGTNRPRKNLRMLLEAFARFAKEEKEHFLVLAGRMEKRFFDVGSEINSLGLHDRAIMLGFVDEKDKGALLRNSEALVFPSLYEGFGLPVLEAQEAGVPVVTSELEVAGDGALTIDPQDGNSIARALSQIAGDPSLRSSLIQKGKANLRRFSWNLSAQKLLEFISEK